MKIGMTYDLKGDYLAAGMSEEAAAEFDRLDTVESVESCLRSLGHEVERIGNLKKLVDALAQGSRWDLVFNFAEGLGGFGREAQVPALLEAYGIPFTFSDSLVMALSLHKGMTKHFLRDRGIPTAPFVVIERAADLDHFDSAQLRYPLFIKPVAEGTSKGIHADCRVEFPEKLRGVVLELLGKYNQPVLIEEYLPGREFTVGIIGTGAAARCVGVVEIAIDPSRSTRDYTYETKMNYENCVEYIPSHDEVAQGSADVALRAWVAMGCRDAGRVDVRVDREGVPHVIELNPLAGLNPKISDLPILARKNGISYETLIRDIVQSASERMKG